MSWPKFKKDYEPHPNQVIKDAPHEGLMFETYGEEMKMVEQMPERYVWTLIDDGKNTYIRAGQFLVNRLGFFLCKNPWKERGDTIELEDESDNP